MFRIKKNENRKSNLQKIIYLKLMKIYMETI